MNPNETIAVLTATLEHLDAWRIWAEREVLRLNTTFPEQPHIPSYLTEDCRIERIENIYHDLALFFTCVRHIAEVVARLAMFSIDMESPTPEDASAAD